MTATDTSGFGTTNVTCTQGDVATEITTTATTDPLISDTLNFVTGFINILPRNTNICQLTYTNLLFAGVEYRGNTNPTIIIPTFDTTSNVTWLMGENDYTGWTSTASIIEADNRGVLVVSTINDTANGVYSGSAVTMTHTANGSGVYKVTDTAEVVTADPGAKLLSLSVTVGTGVITGATGYESEANSGYLIAVVDDAGLYHFSTDVPFSLDKSVEVSGGVEGAPDEIVLEMTNLFDFEAD